MATVRATVLGVAKYKPKFDCTGFKLSTDQGEFWADIKGEHNWKTYKDKQFDFNLRKEGDYWKGELANSAPQHSCTNSGQIQKQTRAKTNNGDEIIAQCAAKIVKDLICAGKFPQGKPTEQEICDWFYYIKRVANGTVKPATQQESFQQQQSMGCNDEPPATDGDIPFEKQYNL